MKRRRHEEPDPGNGLGLAIIGSVMFFAGMAIGVML